MDFLCIVLFLAIYHLKPQEWTTIFATVRFAQLVMLASLATLFFRERSLKIGDFFKTPHDWAMLFFFGWVVVASPTPVSTFQEFLSRLVFYIVTVQTLTNWERIRKFLGWWTAFIVITAALALLAEYQIFDPLGSYAITHGIMKDRLILNLSMVNNPNALGHTLVPCITMLYYFCIWKRPVFMQQVGYALLFIPLAAIYLTYSKGTYVVGAIAILTTFTFGRPKWVQIVIATILIGGASSSLYLLPRMGELQRTKTDEAVQGRIKAFTYGYGYYDNFIRGIGQGNFIKRLQSDHKYYKAPHSTYVQTGAELGVIGMFFFILVMFCNLKTLITARTRDAEQERIRRILFALLITYAVSGWMVDFAYRATFFLFTAAIAAFHRHLLAETTGQPEKEEEPDEPREPWRARLQPVPQPAGLPAMPMLITADPAPTFTSPRAGIKAPARTFPWQQSPKHGQLAQIAEDEEIESKPLWNRITLADVILTIVAVKAVEMVWVWAINNI